MAKSGFKLCSPSLRCLATCNVAPGRTVQTALAAEPLSCLSGPVPSKPRPCSISRAPVFSRVLYQRAHKPSRRPLEQLPGGLHVILM